MKITEKESENIKFKICKDCRKCIQKNYVDCAFQKFDNEFCGDLKEIIKNYTKYQKISFAVEQLEKVKEEAKYYGYEFSKSMNEYIDKQIEQIKRNKYGNNI